MRLLVVSDLHVQSADDPMYGSLLKLLRERAKPGDTVVLGGDVFDLFVGNKAVFLNRYAEFTRVLREACARGVKVHYIEGNHDFLIRRAFGGIDGCVIHTHDVSVELGGKKFYFAHGDTVDSADYRYRVLRSFFRSPIMKTFVALAPGGLLDRIGKTASKQSSTKAPRLPSELPIDRAERLRKAYRSFAADRLQRGYDFVVLGHCHDLDEMRFQVGNRSGQYVNVGYPRVHKSFLTWSEGDPSIQREPLP